MPVDKGSRLKVNGSVGRLTFREKVRIKGRPAWICDCSCGNTTTVLQQSLTKSNPTKSCGCLLAETIIEKFGVQAKEVLGKIYHNWTVESISNRRGKSGGIYFFCKCSCGEIREVASTSLMSKRSKSCGLCGLDKKPVCKFGHVVKDWGGRTPSGGCKACVKHKSLMRNYGLSLNEYLQIWDFQKGKCAICNKNLDKGISTPGWVKDCSKVLGRPELDHEHGSKTVNKKYARGILCGGRWAGCNRKLGRIDNLQWLQNVIKYLENPPARQVIMMEEDVKGH